MNVEEEINTYTFSQWLQSRKSSNTRSLYGASVGSFLHSIYQTDETTEKLAARYVKDVKKGKRKTLNDLLDFITFTQSGKARKDGKVVPPNSLSVYFTGIISFLFYCCGEELSPRARRVLQDSMPRGGRFSRTKEADITRETIRAILLHCDLRLKSLVLFLVSSGVRISEALKLKLDDITLDAKPPLVFVRADGTKEGEPTVTFISDEAKAALQEWLKIRETYIRENAYRVNNVKEYRKTHRPWRKVVTPPSEDSVFPYSYPSATIAFSKAVKAAGLYAKDKTTGRASIHLHAFRKYFLSQIKTKIPSEIAEALVGHQGYLSGSYRRYPTSQLAELYKKGEGALLVFQDSAPLEELDTRNRQFDEVARRNQALDAELQNLKAKNESLQATIAKWDAYFTEKFGKPTAQTADEMAHNLLVEKLAQRTAEAQAEEDFAELLKVGATKSPEQRA